jgi:hypothetical protein
MKSQDLPVRCCFDHAKLRRKIDRDGHGRNSHLGAFPLVKLDHLADVHPINVVCAEDGHQMLIHMFNEVDVLIDGVGRALVPGLVNRTHLCRNRDDEMIL